MTRRSGCIAGLLLLGLALAAGLGNAQSQPLCPSTRNDIPSLTPWTACTVTILLTKTPEQIEEYKSSGADDACIAEKNSCAGAAKFNQCPTITQDLMEFIVPDVLQNSSLVQCPNFFKGYAEYCNRPFGELVSVYCPPGPLIPVPAIGGIVAGGVAMILLVCFVCWRTKRSIALDKEIEAAITFSSPTDSAIKGNQVIQSSENPTAALIPGSAKKSRYHGVVWNFSAGAWDAIYETPTVREWLGTFMDEEQAARKYDARILQLRQAGVTMAPLNFADDGRGGPAASPAMQQGSMGPPPGLGYSMQIPARRGPGADDPNLERHIQDLITFYQYHDPDRPDIEAHVISLFEKYTFKGIARAMLRKYGVLPPGWEMEYDATRSIAMSMAARVFNGPSASGQGVALPPQQAVAITGRDPMPDF